MERNTILVGGVLLLLGLGIGYAIGGREPVIGNHMMPSGSMMADDSMMSRNIDQHFIVQMIPHHEGAIEMAKIALERSKRAEIISLSNGIIEAQEREITNMSAWYESWFGSTPPSGGMGMMHMDSMTGDASSLRNVPAAEFDREFMTQMIPHHEMAIMMAQMLQASTARDEMKTLAENIITSQSNEITKMRGWLTSWYKI